MRGFSKSGGCHSTRKSHRPTGRDPNEENGRKKKRSIRSLEKDEREEFSDVERKRKQLDEKRLALEEINF